MLDYSVIPSPSPFPQTFRIWDFGLGLGFGTWTDNLDIFFPNACIAFKVDLLVCGWGLTSGSPLRHSDPRRDKSCPHLVVEFVTGRLADLWFNKYNFPCVSLMSLSPVISSLITLNHHQDESCGHTYKVYTAQSASASPRLLIQHIWSHNEESCSFIIYYFFFFSPLSTCNNLLQLSKCCRAKQLRKLWFQHTDAGEAYEIY